jgi:hypothetical protein
MSGIVNQAGVDSGQIGQTQTLVTAAGASGGGGGSATHTAIADGALANGDRVVLQADGKVRVIAQSAGSGAETITSDNQAHSLGARWENPTIAYDPNDVSKFAIMYRVWNTGMVIRVGQITGTTISFGTDQILDSNNTNGGHYFQWHPKITNCILSTYGMAASPAGTGWTVKAGIVSGTSISWGWTETFNTNDYTMSSAFHIDCDSASSQTDKNGFVAICHSDRGGMDHYELEMACGYISDDASTGTKGGVGLIAGGPMAMGFNPRMHAVRFDPTTEGKVALFYDDPNNSMQPAVRISHVDYGSLAGHVPTISHGSNSTFDSGNNWGDRKELQWLTGGGKIICSGRKQYYPSLVIGTVGGSAPPGGSWTFTWGTILQIDSSQNPTYDIYKTSLSSTRVYAIGKTASGTGPIIGKVINISGTTMTAGNTSDIMTGVMGGINDGFGTFDGSSKIMVRALQGNNSTDYTKFTSATIGAPGSSNLAAGNFIGISDGAYADGVTATIQLSSPSIDDAQSGLTPGSSYYVQTDGSLSTTAGTPAVLAGIALSATQLLIKG